jgi:hypothetical protein
LKLSDDDDNHSNSCPSAPKDGSGKLTASQRRRSELEGLTVSVVDDASSRVIDWIVDSLSGYLQQIVSFLVWWLCLRACRSALTFAIFENLAKATRRSQQKKPSFARPPENPTFSTSIFHELDTAFIPSFDTTTYPVDDAFFIDSRVIDELYQYVYNIIAMYNDNPFHNL